MVQLATPVCTISKLDDDTILLHGNYSTFSSFVNYHGLNYAKGNNFNELLNASCLLLCHSQFQSAAVNSKSSKPLTRLCKS
jgi:hypothetical protein